MTRYLSAGLAAAEMREKTAQPGYRPPPGEDQPPRSGTDRNGESGEGHCNPDSRPFKGNHLPIQRVLVHVLSDTHPEKALRFTDYLEQVVGDEGAVTSLQEGVKERGVSIAGIVGPTRDEEGQLHVGILIRDDQLPCVLGTVEYPTGMMPL